MRKGKEKCEILKGIRRKIAEENGIDLDISECTFEGECRGTCPKCEAELKYLDSALRSRRNSGRSVRIAGISAGAIAMLSPIVLSATPDSEQSLVYLENIKDTIDYQVKGMIPRKSVERIDTVFVDEPKTIHKLRGQVFEGTEDGEKADPEPLIGASIKNLRTNEQAVSNLDGWFEIDVCPGDTLRMAMIGMEIKNFVITDLDKTEFVLPQSMELMGEVVYIGDSHKLGKVKVLRQTDGIELKIFNKAGQVFDPESLYIDIRLLDTTADGKIIKDEDGDVDYIALEPTSENSETVFISYRDLFNHWFSGRLRFEKKSYPQKIVLRIGQGTFVKYKDVKISIPKEAIESDSAPKSNDWNNNLLSPGYKE